MKMKIEKNIIILTLVMVISLSGIISCTKWSTRDWNEIKDRKFYFQKFTYKHTGETQESSFDFMKSTPLTEMLNMVANKYNIIIDVTEFQNFIYSGDYLMIDTFGVFQDEVFTWESRKKQVNQIEIEYEMRPEIELKSEAIIYRFLIKNNGRVRASYFDRVYDKKDILKNLATNLGYGGTADIKNRLIVADRKSRESYTYNSNDVKNETEAIIKRQIALYVRGLKPDEKKVFRNELVRFINEICREPISYPIPSK